MHREPVPLPDEEPFQEDVPHPVPQEEPVPDPNPEMDSKIRPNRQDWQAGK